MLPLDSTNSFQIVEILLDSTNSFQIVEILICGGEPENAYNKLKSSNFIDTVNNFGIIVITYRNPRWLMDKMTRMMAMPDMLILPNREMNIAYAERKKYTQCTCTMNENSEGHAA